MTTTRPEVIIGESIQEQYTNWATEHPEDENGRVDTKAEVTTIMTNAFTLEGLDPPTDDAIIQSLNWYITHTTLINIKDTAQILLDTFLAEPAL